MVGTLNPFFVQQNAISPVFVIHENALPQKIENYLFFLAPGGRVVRSATGATASA
jgi:hypothetical protein